jgi:hypothetical protein
MRPIGLSNIVNCASRSLSTYYYAWAVYERLIMKRGNATGRNDRYYTLILLKK